MINFERITWQQLLTLSKVIHSSSSLSLRVIARWYNSETTNFNDTLEFFEKIGVIKIKGNIVKPDVALKRNVGTNDELIKQFFVNVLFRKKNTLRKYLGDFIDHFELYDDYYKFTPTIQERLKYSGIRNFLIGLGVLRFEPQTNSYLIKKELIVNFPHKSKVLTYHKFEKILKSEKELGFAVEEKVYKFEKNKFINNPDIQKRIRHTSLENVTAGYDVISFETPIGKNPVLKYIEVKAVSDDNWKFFWSRNEISKAIQLGGNYYLYLIPIKNGKVLKTSAWRQIKNPYNEVFQDKLTWRQEVELTSFVIGG